MRIEADLCQTENGLLVVYHHLPNKSSSRKIGRFFKETLTLNLKKILLVIFKKKWEKKSSQTYKPYSCDPHRTSGKNSQNKGLYITLLSDTFDVILHGRIPSRHSNRSRDIR